MFATVVHSDAALMERLAEAAVGTGATVFVPTNAALRDFTNGGRSLNAMLVMNHIFDGNLTTELLARRNRITSWGGHTFFIYGVSPAGRRRRSVGGLSIGAPGASSAIITADVMGNVNGCGHVIDAVLPQLNPDGSLTVAATFSAPSTTAVSDTDDSSNGIGDLNVFEGRSTEVIVLGGFGGLLLLLIAVFAVVLIRRRQAQQPPAILLPPQAQYYDTRPLTLTPDGSQLMQYTRGDDMAGSTGPSDTIMVRSTLGGDYVEVLQEQAESGLSRRGTVTLGGDPFLRAGEIPFDSAPVDVRSDTATPDPPGPEPDSVAPTNVSAVPPVEEVLDEIPTRKISLMTSEFNKTMPAPAPPPPPMPQHLPASTPASSNPSRTATSSRRPSAPATPLRSIHPPAPALPPPPPPQQHQVHFYPGHSPFVEHGPAPVGRATRAKSKQGPSARSRLAAPVHPSLLLREGQRRDYFDTVPYNPMDPAAAHEFNRTGSSDSMYYNSRSNTPIKVAEGVPGHNASASVMYTSIDHSGSAAHHDPNYTPALQAKLSRVFAPDRSGELRRNKRDALQSAAGRWRQSIKDAKQGRR